MSLFDTYVGCGLITLIHSFDVDYPVDVDDEYWDTGDPETSFKQPEGVNSKLSYFVCILKLCRIIGEVIRTVVSGLVPCCATRRG